MVDYTSPITTTFELQRETIKQGQQALEQGLEFQRSFNQALVDGLDGQEGAQRRAVELQREAILNALDALDANVPGAESATAEIRETVDEQFEQLLANHEEVFQSFADEFESGTGSYDEFATEYLEALDDQLSMVIDAHEDLEAQSTDAASDIVTQLESLQEQVEEVQSEIADLQPE